MSEITAASGHFSPQGFHEIHFRVYYEDTDAAGVVYYANYLRFAERGRTEALRLAGIGQAGLWESQGVGFVVRRVAVDYKAPARLDDVLMIRTEVADVGKTRLGMRQSVVRADTLLAVVEVDVVAVDASLRPVRLPPAVVSALAFCMPTVSGAR